MFEERLQQGKMGESQIANWLKSRGHNILPVYENETNQFKGPTVHTSAGKTLIAPDMIAFGKGETIWIEAKHKNAFTMHRITNEWVTGIDLHHYNQYKEIMRLVDWPVWLLFLQKGGSEKGSLIKSPAGLFGGKLNYLISNVHHTSQNYGKGGMVYWAYESLKLLADYPLIETIPTVGNKDWYREEKKVLSEQIKLKL